MPVETDPIGGVIPQPPPPPVLLGGETLDVTVQLSKTFDVPVDFEMTSTYPEVARSLLSTVVLDRGQRSSQVFRIASMDVTNAVFVTIAGYSEAGILAPLTVIVLPKRAAAELG